MLAYNDIVGEVVYDGYCWIKQRLHTYCPAVDGVDEALRIFLVGNPKKVVPVIVCNLAVFEERIKVYRLYVKFIE